MTFSTYADLQTNIAAWLARDDLTPYIPDFIRLFEAAAARRLKVRPQESVVVLTATAGSATLPTDFLGVRNVTWTGSVTPRNLDYVAPYHFIETNSNDTSGIPYRYTIRGTILRVAPASDGSVGFSYFARTAGLDTALNWLYTNHYDAYLFGALAEANAFSQDVDIAGLWKARRDEAFDEIYRLDFNERAGLQMRVTGYTP